MQVAIQRQRILVNVGCGPAHLLTRTSMFLDWHQVRVDIDKAAQPDVVADITDLSPLSDGTADALWASHCLEHLYQHQAQGALAEFHRVLSDDGFAVILVPDIQALADLIGTDKLHEVIYNSPAGPVSAHDMIYGFGPAIAAGQSGMAHRCGFTPTILVNLLNATSFAEYIIRRLPTLELVVVARKTATNDGSDCQALLQALAL
jgi:SAM-dependent methyltransferase